MTERFHSLTVVLVDDVREDDAEALMSAIRMIRGVISVSGKVSDIQSHIAEARARRKLGDAIWDVIYKDDK